MKRKKNLVSGAERKFSHLSRQEEGDPLFDLHDAMRKGDLRRGTKVMNKEMQVKGSYILRILSGGREL